MLVSFITWRSLSALVLVSLMVDAPEVQLAVNVDCGATWQDLITPSGKDRWLADFCKYQMYPPCKQVE